MAVQYYVKRKLASGAWTIVETCPTPENARRQMELYRKNNVRDYTYAVFYSKDALAKHIQKYAVLS